MMRCLIARLVLLSAMVFAGAAAAQDLPALYAVRNVAANDVLNIRAEPNGDAAQIGTLAPAAKGVEVVALSKDGKWAQVNAAETAGWVALRYLQRESAINWTTLDGNLTCSGTEPFWSLTYDGAQKNMYFSEMGQENIGLWIDWKTAAAGRSGIVAMQIKGPSREGFATLRAASCNDGMSDKQMGIAVEFFLRGVNGSAAPALGLSGCCHVKG